MPVEISGGPFPPDRQDVLAAVLARVPGIEPEEAALLAVVTPCVVRAADEARLVEDLSAAGFEARYVAEPVGTNPAVLTTPADANVVPVAASVGPSRVGIWIAVGALAVVGAGLVGVGIGGRRAEPPPAPATDVLPGVSVAREPVTDDPLPDALATPPAEEGGWTTGRTSRSAEAGFPALPVAIRTGRHFGYDRVVFEFDGESMPAASVSFGSRFATVCESDGEVEVEGATALAVAFSAGPADVTRSVPPAALDQQPRLPVLRDIASTCSLYVPDVSWLIGLAESRPYRTLVLRDPLRFVLDVQNGT